MMKKKTNFSTSFTTNSLIPTVLIKNSFSHFVTNISNLKLPNNSQRPFTGRLGIAEAVHSELGNKLKLFINNSVVKEIENDRTLDNLTEIKRVTILSVNVYPNKSSVFELISLIDHCCILITNLIEDSNGTININLLEKFTNFEIIFGIIDNFDNVAKLGITMGRKIVDTLKTNLNLHAIAVGISTGTVFCSVIGHIARRYYAIVGRPVKISAEIASVSINKVCCDTDTVVFSEIGKHLFQQGLTVINENKKTFLFEYIGDQNGLLEQKVQKLDFIYPNLEQFQEMEIFSEILDDINVENRKYAGLLIEGLSRSGKSRILDVYVTIAKSRQIRTIQLDINCSFLSKSNSVIFHILEQIFRCEECNTIEEREKFLIKILYKVIDADDFCYFNSLMRVEFPLSKNYCSETDMERHLKRVNIVKEILKRSNERICILLDNVQFIDVMSWQYLIKFLNNSRIIIIMTMMKGKIYDNFSQIPLNIQSHERVKKFTLNVLTSKSLTAFACQFLNVCAIPQKLERLLIKNSGNNLEWCELFLMLILQARGLNFLTMTQKQAKTNNLIFLDNTLFSKIHVDLLPDEVVPPKSWNRMKKLPVCLLNDKFTGFSDSHFPIDGNYASNSFATFQQSKLKSDMKNQIFERMLPHERNLIKCASFIGDFFSRDFLMQIMENCSTENTARAVESLIRIRILECASIRRSLNLRNKTNICSFRKRNFSDVHHLIECHCYEMKSFVPNKLPHYAYCKFLEFKSTAFREKIYKLLTSVEKDGFFCKTVKILDEKFRKCEACGEGEFLRQNTNEVLNLNDCSSVSQQLNISQPLSYSRNAKKCNSVEPEPKSGFLQMKNFNHIDHRNCQCSVIINSVLWKFPAHIDKSGNNCFLIRFLIQYGAALIENAEFGYAIKILSMALEKIQASSIDTEENRDSKSLIYCLIGNACFHLGRYNLAKINYLQALSMYNYKFKTGNNFSKWNLRLETFLRQNFMQRFMSSGLKTISKDTIRISQLLSFLSVALLMEGKQKSSLRACHVSVNLGFRNTNTLDFLEKCQLFLLIANNFEKLENYRLLQIIIYNIFLMIREKENWSNLEELIVLANVFLAIIKIKFRRGSFAKTVAIGSKLLRLTDILHLNKIKLIVLPLIIESMIRLKRINQTVDLMHELLYLSPIDSDKSSLAWYYALCIDLILDAGITLETYQTCLNFAEKVIDKKYPITRDPEGKKRLIVSLRTWQLRSGITVNKILPLSVKSYLNLTKLDELSEGITACRILECHLLTLVNYMNVKKYQESDKLMEKISKIIKLLESKSKINIFIKPRLYLLKAYFFITKNENFSKTLNIYKAKKLAKYHGNLMDFASIVQNEKAWKTTNYRNIPSYWIEYISNGEGIDWRYIDSFNISEWTTILYSMPIPDPMF
ncbi:adenylate cyclase type 10-like [Leptopilina heterotoma]|uniref:adenylate cyclase type 10-like n=1 Tax=Leptopilina heterotoma TaxID=63436 RepID=UPI001CA885CC|nr:adenylate cyclase type 10-like [Leptopilina heterotoma]